MFADHYSSLVIQARSLHKHETSQTL